MEIVYLCNNIKNSFIQLLVALIWMRKHSILIWFHLKKYYHSMVRIIKNTLITSIQILKTYLLYTLFLNEGYINFLNLILINFINFINFIFQSLMSLYRCNLFANLSPRLPRLLVWILFSLSLFLFEKI